MFEQSMLEGAVKTRRVWTVMVSFLGQMVAIGIAVLIPMVAFDRLPQAWLVPRPDPPPRAPRPRGPEAKPHVTIVSTEIEIRHGVFTAPPHVPTTIAMIADPPQPQANSGSDPGVGVPGGIGDPSGRGSSVVESIARDAAKQLPPAPPVTPVSKTVVEKSPVRITMGGVVVQSKLIHKVTPAYPTLPKQAGISGMVRLQAVISRDGRIQELRVQSGHPLLVQAALDAVRQWIYSPTLLNGEPVEVITTIDVNFMLNR